MKYILVSQNNKNLILPNANLKISITRENDFLPPRFWLNNEKPTEYNGKTEQLVYISQELTFSVNENEPLLEEILTLDGEKFLMTSWMVSNGMREYTYSNEQHKIVPVKMIYSINHTVIENIETKAAEIVYEPTLVEIK